MAALTSEKVDFRIRTTVKEKTRYKDKRVNSAKNITTLNVYTPNNQAIKYMNPKVIEKGRKNRQIKVILVISRLALY